MKALLTIFPLLFTFMLGSGSAPAQRYLNTVFTDLDSVIGGTYGTAVNVQSVNQSLLFDFYEPKNDPETSRPFILYIHGGGFTSGDRDYPSVKLLCRELAKRGYAVATIDYRLDPGFDIYNSNTDRRAMTDAMHDAKQAIRYFKANSVSLGLDTTLFFIGGESAGAATAMMASYLDKQSEMGSYPMASPNDPVGSTANAGHSNDVAATMCLCGLLLDTLAMETSADPPLLWTHGTDDNFVPITLAFNIVLRAAHIGLPIQTHVYQGGVHCPWYFGNPNWATYLDSTLTDISTFLYPKVLAQLSTNQDQTQNWEVFPNPIQNKMTVRFEQVCPSTRISIIANTGAVLAEKEQAGVREIEIDMQDYSPGWYVIEVACGEKVGRRKVVKHW